MIVIVEDVQDVPPIFTMAPPVTQLPAGLLPGDKVSFSFNVCASIFNIKYYVVYVDLLRQHPLHDCGALLSSTIINSH